MSDTAHAAGAAASTASAAVSLVGGAGAAAGIGAGLSALVVMTMMTPRSPREWAVGIISTVVLSIGGGAAVVVYFGLLQKVQALHGEEQFFAFAALLGLVFACGLPAWALVRWIFTTIERRRDKDLGELWDEVRGKRGAS